MSHIFNASILREYDVRGVVGKTLHEEDAYALGRAYASLALEEGARSIAVGRDGRTHSPDLEGELIRGLIEKHWLPRLEAFKPEMVFISAGFDAHRDDDLGQLGLVEADYTWMTKRIKEIANKYAKGRIVSSLEGGYNLDALGRSVEAHVRALADL